MITSSSRLIRIGCFAQTHKGRLKRLRHQTDLRIFERPVTRPRDDLLHGLRIITQPTRLSLLRRCPSESTDHLRKSRKRGRTRSKDLHCNFRGKPCTEPYKAPSTTRPYSTISVRPHILVST